MGLPSAGSYTEVADLAYTALTLDTPMPSGAFYGPYFGTAFDTGYEFWLDEAIVGTEPIGCAK